MLESLPMSDMEDRRIYRIRSRNLVVGAWREATKGFIGIRMKFDHLYLFEEYHYETGPPLGTARAVRAYDQTVPADIDLSERSEALFALLTPLDAAINLELAEENRLAMIEAESKRWAPQTRAEFDQEVRVAAVKAKYRPLRAEALLIEDEAERIATNKKIHRQWVADLTAAIKGE